MKLLHQSASLQYLQTTCFITAAVMFTLKSSQCDSMNEQTLIYVKIHLVLNTNGPAACSSGGSSCLMERKHLKKVQFG